MKRLLDGLKAAREAVYVVGVVCACIILLMILPVVEAAETPSPRRKTA